MSQLDPSKTTVGDICSAALKESGAFGPGTTPLAEDITDALARLQWMLQQWVRKRWLVWNLLDYAVVSTGAQFYSIGPGGDIDTNQALSPWNPQFNNQFGPSNPVSARPAKIEAAFSRQLTQSQPNQIDYPLTLILAREDYDKIALKELTAGPSGYLFYDSAWPLGFLFPWPMLQANIYELHVTVRSQLPVMFPTFASVFSTVPYEYYAAMMYNLALRLRPKYGIPTMPGDQLPGLAKDSLAVLRDSNAQIARLHMPGDLVRPQLYNIFSDRMY